MTKREREALLRRIKRLEEKIAKKRDELREIIEGSQALIASVEDACDSMDASVEALKAAHEHVDYAADSLSQYV